MYSKYYYLRCILTNTCEIQNTREYLYFQNENCRPMLNAQCSKSTFDNLYSPDCASDSVRNLTNMNKKY